MVSGLKKSEIKDFLDEKFLIYNNIDFIKSDPIQIPKQFSVQQDIEIASFFVATIAWGNRVSIIKNAQNLMDRMGNAPYDFVMNASTNDLKSINGFVHRTFNDADAHFFTLALRNIYSQHKSLESLFIPTNYIRPNITTYSHIILIGFFINKC